MLKTAATILAMNTLHLCPGSSIYSNECEIIAAPTVIIDQGISATPQPKCEDGWVLMTYPGTSIPMCARELKEPTRE